MKRLAESSRYTSEGSQHILWVCQLSKIVVLHKLYIAYQIWKTRGKQTVMLAQA
jgi:type IV secretory pathway VirB4 component